MQTLQFVQKTVSANTKTDYFHSFHFIRQLVDFYPCDAMLARVFAIATCLDVCPSVCLSHAGIVPSTAKAGS